MVIALDSPFLVGVYQNNNLLLEFSSSSRVSEGLPNILKKILEDFDCDKLYYAKGPGSFMAIKITYLTLKTLSIVYNIPLFASDGFAFNNNFPIKSIGNLWFIKDNGSIKLEKIDIHEKRYFALPKTIDHNCFTQENEPLYVLPAV